MKTTGKTPAARALGKISTATLGSNKGIIEFVGLYTPAMQLR